MLKQDKTVELFLTLGLAATIGACSNPAPDNHTDQVSAKRGDCSTQRMLSEKGWQQSKDIDQAFESLKIPVGEVYSSQYCRAWQTADLAFNRHKADQLIVSNHETV